MTANGLGVRLGRLASLGRVAARVLPVDTNPIPASWRHLTKVDPEERRRLPLLFPRYLAHTDAVVVGGSTAVTGANTEATFALLSPVETPVFHEPSDPTHVTDATREQAAFIAIPQVLNGSVDAFLGTLGGGIERVRTDLAPALVADHVPAWTPSVLREALADAATSWLLETAAFEAYLVQNPDSAAAREAGVGVADVLEPGEAARRAMVADRYLRTPVVYVEYSGRFGGSKATRLLAAVSDAVSEARVWYGGGLATAEDTRAMLAAGADAVVVGNAFHAVAREEATLFERARDTLAPDAPRAQVASWLADTVTLEETAAAAYLSTIPTCTHPVATAERLLVDTLSVWSRLRACSPQASDTELDRVVSLVGVASATEWTRAALAATHGHETTLSAQLSPFAVGRSDGFGPTDTGETDDTGVDG
jgi:phosphoglycerol geranylgeranyltransferase